MARTKQTALAILFNNDKNVTHILAAGKALVEMLPRKTSLQKLRASNQNKLAN